MASPSTPDHLGDDPVAEALEQAPEDDEELTDEERAEIEAARREPPVDHETVRRIVGLAD